MSQSIRTNPVQILEHTILVKNTDIDDEILDYIVDARNMHLSKGIVLENCTLSREYQVFLRELPHLSLLSIQDCAISDLGAKRSIEFGRHQEISDEVLKILKNFRYEPFFDPPLKEIVLVKKESIKSEPVITVRQFADTEAVSSYIVHTLTILREGVTPGSSLCIIAGRLINSYYLGTHGRLIGSELPICFTSTDLTQIHTILSAIT